MSERSNGPGMTMLSSSGTRGTELLGSDQPHPVEHGQKPDTDACQGVDACHGVFSQAEHLAKTVKDKANAAMVGVGERISGVAEGLREHSPGSFAPYTGKAAAGLEQAGSYLQRGTIGGVLDDLTDFMGRHPMPLVLTGMALGFMLGRKLRR